MGEFTYLGFSERDCGQNERCMMAAKASLPNGKMAVYANGHTSETVTQADGRSDAKTAKTTNRSFVRWTFGLIVR